MQKSRFFILLVCAGVLAACAPTKAVRGNLVEDHREKQIEPGVSSRADVLRVLGSPTTQAPFDENIWYYIGQKTEKTGIFDPKVVEERIVKVTFSDLGLVETVNLMGNMREDIPINNRKTPTGGTSVTAVQQFLGNLGKYNQKKASATAIGKDVPD